jgi:hypothetical protein
MPLLLLLSLLASPAFAKTIPVELGKEFRLKKGEVGAIAGTKATLRIARFINSPCPKGARCVWSGQAVIMELTVDGKVVPDNAKDFPYDITAKDSDYKTWASMVVAEPEGACHRPDAGHLGECLRRLARRRGDPALCRKIDEERTRVRCFKELSKEGGGGPRSCAELAPAAAKECLEAATGPGD